MHIISEGVWMLKKSMLIAAAAALVIMSGCSSKEPEVVVEEPVKTEVAQAQPAVETPSTDVVDEGGVADISTLPVEDKMDQIKTIEAKTESIYFDFDKFAIRDDMQGALGSDAALFTSSDVDDLTIKIEGNCDEWGTDEYNYALGLKRAKSVRDALVIKGVNESQMVMVSYGESNPVCMEHAKECWEKNRRVDFKLLP